jgi:uncharacterized protein YegL
MKEGFTEIICVIDRSGSMMQLRSDAVGGMNSFLTEQKAVPGEANLTLVFFNHEYQLVYDGKSLREVPVLSDADYVPQGTTALLDAVGRAIDDVGNRLANTPEEQRPDKVLVAIMTDGLENASRDYTRARVAEMIKHQQEQYNWEFLFLAANMDAFAEAQSLNIPKMNAQNFAATRDGTRTAYNNLNQRTTAYRTRR